MSGEIMGNIPKIMLFIFITLMVLLSPVLLNKIKYDRDYNYERRIGPSSYIIPAIEDINNDGRNELLLINRTSYTSGWCGTPSYFDKIEIYYPENKTLIWQSDELRELVRIFEIEDINNDFEKELIVGFGNTLRIYNLSTFDIIAEKSFYHKRMGGCYNTPVVEYDVAANIFDLKVSNINDDSDKEIIISVNSYLCNEDKGQLIVLNGFNLEEKFNWSRDMDEEFHELFIRDLNNDSIKEIIMLSDGYHSDKGYTLFIFNASTNKLDTQVQTRSYREHTTLIFNDLNGDNIEDLFFIVNTAGGTYQSSYFTDIYALNGQNRSYLYQKQTYQNINIIDSVVINLKAHNESNNNILLVSTAPSWWDENPHYYIDIYNLTNQTLYHQIEVNSTYVFYEDIILENRSGFEIVVGTSDGYIKIYDIINQTFTFSTKILGSINNIFSADVNSDGEMELIILVGDNNQYEYPNESVIILSQDFNIIQTY